MNDVGYLDTIYAPSMVPRNKYEHQLRALRVPGGVGTTADYKLHKLRRDALATFFGKRNVLFFERHIVKKIDQLCQLIGRHVSSETPVNLSDVFFAFSSEYVFPRISSTKKEKRKTDTTPY